MKMSKFIKSTLILLVGGFLTKVLGMLIKIITTRIIGTETLGLYMLIMPTFNLFITLAQGGLPISVSKIVSENTKDNKKIVFSSIFISICTTFFLMILLIFISPLIAKFLHNDSLSFPIMCIGLTLPFISLSGIIRGYFFGKENMFPHVLSNNFEQVVRIILNIIFLPLLSNYEPRVSVTFLILSNVISETTSIIILYFFLPRKIKVTKEMLKPEKIIIKDVLNISITDNGCGMSPEILAWINSPEPEKRDGHLGLYNIMRILKLYYGNEYGLKAEVTEDGTTVTLSLPVRMEGDDV